MKRWVVKTTKRQKKAKSAVESRILQRLEEFTLALETGEKISEKFVVRRVVLPIKLKSFGPEEIKEIRKLLGVNEAMFASFLGVSVKTVRAWEQGLHPPKSVTCRFLDEIQKNPGHFQKRLKDFGS